MRYIESFSWGILAALGALVIQLVAFISISFFYNQISFSQFSLIPQFVFLLAFIEEAFKYILIAKRAAMLPDKKTIILNSFLIGLGFFAVELAFIATSGPLPALYFLIGIAVVHLGTAGLIGYLITARKTKSNSDFLWIIIISTFFHAAYNLLISR